MLDKLHIAEIHYQRGVVLEQAGRLNEAVDEYRQALSNNPRLRAAHLALAGYYQRHGLTARAIAALDEAVSIEPDYEALQRLASLQLELRRFEEARAAVQLSARLSGDKALIAYQLALIAYHEERYPQALALLAGWERDLDDLWRYHQLAGRCALRLGSYDEALACLGRAMLRTNDPAHLAQLLYEVRVAERAGEFCGVLTVRDQIYIAQGTVCLGASQEDDRTHQRPDQRAWTYEQLAATVRRAGELAGRGVWRSSVIVALTLDAEPLAGAFAQLLGQPCINLQDLRADDVPLLVAGALSDPALLNVSHERVAQPCFTYAQSVSWRPDAAHVWPDLVGMPAGAAELPWAADLAELRRSRSGSAPGGGDHSALLAQASASLLAALEQPTAAEQALADYYERDHLKLRWSNARA
ncbi:MAG TPA: tetratricopeptide repeat protein [Herpetosiphonaceae bacterium]